MNNQLMRNSEIELKNYFKAFSSMRRWKWNDFNKRFTVLMVSR